MSISVYPKYVLALRTCDKNLRSFSSFQWPSSGIVRAPDWERAKRCGNGLHGLLWGEGGEHYLGYGKDLTWMVVAIPDEDGAWIEIVDKIKFPECEVVFCGDRQSATMFLWKYSDKTKVIAQGLLKVGDGEKAIVGANGVAQSGNYGESYAKGWESLAITGDYGLAYTDRYCYAVGGKNSTISIPGSSETKIQAGENSIVQVRDRSINGKYIPYPVGYGERLRPGSWYEYDSFYGNSGTFLHIDPVDVQSTYNRIANKT